MPAIKKMGWHVKESNIRVCLFSHTYLLLTDLPLYKIIFNIFIIAATTIWITVGANLTVFGSTTAADASMRRVFVEHYGVWGGCYGEYQNLQMVANDWLLCFFHHKKKHRWKRSYHFTQINTTYGRHDGTTYDPWLCCAHILSKGLRHFTIACERKKMRYSTYFHLKLLLCCVSFASPQVIAYTIN